MLLILVEVQPEVALGLWLLIEDIWYSFSLSDALAVSQAGAPNPSPLPSAQENYSPTVPI